MTVEQEQQQQVDDEGQELPPEKTETDPQGGQEPDPLSELPEWAQKEIKDLRTEAASRRTKLREAQEALSKAKTPEEFEAATSELAAQIADLEDAILRRSVADEHGLPADLADLLPKGADKAQVEAAAKALARYVPSARTPLEPRGGISPGSDAVRFDPAAEVEKIRASGGVF
ncbi:hypothetical protein EDD28_0066 [Salana multivorans]|uniref:Scaffolding protein n=1 Tax=Salana multivorans TaxID=120377 RepID=A0A3N2D6V6_9MICO|nr:hypothetical protein [Salana multivorans]ROR95510.1 hypothetical protein EDD28_0066 [Salana multivorans]